MKKGVFMNRFFALALLVTFALASAFVPCIMAHAAGPERIEFRDEKIVFPEPDIQPIGLDQINAKPADGLPPEVAAMQKTVWSVTWKNRERFPFSKAYLVLSGYDPESKQISFVYSHGLGMTIKPMKIVLKGTFDAYSIPLTGELNGPEGGSPKTVSYTLRLERLLKKKTMELTTPAARYSFAELAITADLPEAR
jgi:hypothetical protein